LLAFLSACSPAVPWYLFRGRAAFYARLLLFFAIAVYGIISVAVVDIFWPIKTGRNKNQNQAMQRRAVYLSIALLTKKNNV